MERLPRESSRLPRRSLLRQGGDREVTQGVQQVPQIVAQAGRSRVEGQPLK
jgi:hypothetical protein